MLINPSLNILHCRLLITTVVPFLTTAANGGKNGSLTNMHLLLHHVNVLTLSNGTLSNESDVCKPYEAFTEGWLRAEGYEKNRPDGKTPAVFSAHSVLWAELHPPRCGDVSSPTITTSKCTGNKTQVVDCLINLNSALRPEAIVSRERMDGDARTTAYFDTSNTITRT